MTWNKKEGRLVKEFEFNNFKESVDFINKILPIAEKQEHHPDILIYSYKKVRVMIYTHDEKKITDKDHRLAEAIDNIS
jgi:4a-hydroxytetrahydrobiopterin dehydratase